MGVKRIVQKFILACCLAAAALLPSGQAQAADYYTVIYNNVSRFNGDSAQADWIARAILYACGEYQVDPLLVTAVMQTESGFNFNASSSAGAVGLMQLMPETAKAVGVDSYDPLGNVIGGTSYLSSQLNAFSGWGEYSVTYAVAAYNAGGGAVRKYGGVPPYAETQNYVVKVADAYNELLAMSQW